jgi:hypothetical protein
MRSAPGCGSSPPGGPTNPRTGSDPIQVSAEESHHCRPRRGHLCSRSPLALRCAEHRAPRRNHRPARRRGSRQCPQRQLGRMPPATEGRRRGAGDRRGRTHRTARQLNQLGWPVPRGPVTAGGPPPGPGLLGGYRRRTANRPGDAWVPGWRVPPAIAPTLGIRGADEWFAGLIKGKGVRWRGRLSWPGAPSQSYGPLALLVQIFDVVGHSSASFASSQKTTVSLYVAGLGLAGSVDAGRSAWCVTRKNNCP